MRIYSGDKKKLKLLGLFHYFMHEEAKQSCHHASFYLHTIGGGYSLLIIPAVCNTVSDGGKHH